MNRRTVHSGLALVVGVLALCAVPVPAATAGTTHAVTIAQFAFGPAAMTIQVGDSVTWTNTDQAAHDVTTTSGPVMIHSPALNTGQSWTYTFATAGTYSYICSVHPDMHGTLVVQPAPIPVSVAPVPAPVRRVAPVAPAKAAPRPITPTTSVAPPSTTTPALALPAPTQVAPTGGQQNSLNPLLLVAGVVAAVATLCLLLISSSPEDR
ncbi:MAG TPA: cupredoxin domain-containing protein [Pseudonocardiaceae bacterium]|jgi:plastocyanin|nr:cupredoxin domain-containing protein [Pseudonocardiaceae bacterium]